MWAHHFTKAVWRVFQADLKEAHHPQNPSTPPHKKLSTNAPHFPQMRSARGALTNETAELLLWADTDQSTWSPHVHNPVEKKTQMCCAHAAPSSRSEQSAQTSAVQSRAARKRALLRAAARRPPPQLLSSALSCTNTTGWQPRLRQNMNGFYEEMELRGKNSFF